MRDERLCDLGIESLVCPAGSSESEIALFEALLETSLPLEYRQFLGRYGASDFNQNVCYVLPSESGPRGQALDRAPFGEFYGFRHSLLDIVKASRRYRGRLRPGLVPIARTPCGDLFCIAVRGHNVGTVYYWDHEREGLGNDPVQSGSLREVASTFSGFLGLLYIEPEPDYVHPIATSYELPE